jgi:hypothetical protein
VACSRDRGDLFRAVEQVEIEALEVFYREKNGIIFRLSRMVGE